MFKFKNTIKPILLRAAPKLFLIALFPAFINGAMAATDGFLQNASGAYTISPQMIIANFSVGQLPFGAISGQFLTVSGKFNLNGKNLKKSSVFLVIKPKSVKTANPETDVYLRGPDFFHVAKFPTATFKSTEINLTGDKTATLTGLLKIKNTSLPVTFKVTFLKARKDASVNNRFVLQFVAKGSFQRSGYGMSAGTPIFSDIVNIDIRITGIRK